MDDICPWNIGDQPTSYVRFGRSQRVIKYGKKMPGIQKSSPLDVLSDKYKVPTPNPERNNYLPRFSSRQITQTSFESQKPLKASESRQPLASLNKSINLILQSNLFQRSYQVKSKTIPKQPNQRLLHKKAMKEQLSDIFLNQILPKISQSQMSSQKVSKNNSSKRLQLSLYQKQKKLQKNQFILPKMRLKRNKSRYYLAQKFNKFEFLQYSNKKMDSRKYSDLE